MSPNPDTEDVSSFTIEEISAFDPEQVEVAYQDIMERHLSLTDKSI